MAESQEPLTDRELSAMKSFMENRAFELRGYLEAPKIIDQWMRARAEFKALPKQREAIVKEIAELETRKAEAEGRARAAAQDASRAQADTDAKLEELSKQIKVYEAERAARQRAIESLETEFVERLKAKEAEIKAAQDRLDKLNADAEQVRKHFAAA